MNLCNRWVAAALAAGWLLLPLGCQTHPDYYTGDSQTGVVRGDDGLDEYYYCRPYTGPLAKGGNYQSLEPVTFTQQGGDYDPAISPDGKWLIYSSTAHSPTPDIYMKSVAGTAVTRLTNTPYAEIQPCFSPDGKYFAYACNRRGNWDICVQSVESGAKPTELTLDMKSDEISPSWHPGGEWIAFSSFSGRTGVWEMAVRNLKTNQTRYLGEGLYPKFSPDGKKLAFQRAREREPRWFSIWVIDLDEEFNPRAPVEIVSSAKWAAINPCWSPDGRYLAFATVHESPLAQSTRRVLMGDDICMVNSQGQDFVHLTVSPEPESHPFWARGKDGKNGRIYFCSMRQGPKNIWALTPVMVEPFGSVSGPLPGPAPENQPPAAAPVRKPETAEPPAAPPATPPATPPAAPPPAPTAKPAAAPGLPEPPPPATAKPE